MGDATSAFTDIMLLYFHVLLLLCACSAYVEPLEISVAADAATRATWRPKENVLVCSLQEHTSAVNRIAVAQDQTYFVSASSDRTARIWYVKGLDRSAFPRQVILFHY